VLDATYAILSRTLRLAKEHEVLRFAPPALLWSVVNADAFEKPLQKCIAAESASIGLAPRRAISRRYKPRGTASTFRGRGMSDTEMTTLGREVDSDPLTSGGRARAEFAARGKPFRFPKGQRGLEAEGKPPPVGSFRCFVTRDSRGIVPVDFNLSSTAALSRLWPRAAS
jgi:hypothetical protein